jgi:hypothetical protein
MLGPRRWAPGINIPCSKGVMKVIVKDRFIGYDPKTSVKKHKKSRADQRGLVNKRTQGFNAKHGQNSRARLVGTSSY